MYWGLKVGGIWQVYPTQYYGHSEAGTYNWHIFWGMRAHPWGVYRSGHFLKYGNGTDVYFQVSGTGYWGGTTVNLGGHADWKS